MTRRNVLVMLVLAVLAVLAWIALGDPEPKGGRLPATMPEGFQREDAVKVVLRAEGNELILRRRTDRTDAWDVERGTVLVRADAARIDDFLVALARQGVRNRYEIGKVGNDLAGFGLASPTISAELTTPQKTYLVRWGRKTAGTGDSVYADTGPGTDVWVVDAGIESAVLSLVMDGLLAKRLTDLRTYDVKGMTVRRGAELAFDAEQLRSGVWRVKAPFDGFAEPTAFETTLSRLGNAEVSKWVEVGATDLKKYGLDQPRAELVLTPKREGATPVSVLIGAETEGGAFVLERGQTNVAICSERFAKEIGELLADAKETSRHRLRDRSFTRLGLDGVAVTFQDGDLRWELRKEGSSWDCVQGTLRMPADRAAVDELLDQIRTWQTVEFQDQGVAADFGIDGKRRIEVEHHGGSRTILSFGKEGDSGTVWAQREGPEGRFGVERVAGDVVTRLLGKDGPARFRQRTVRDFEPFLTSLTRIERNSGTKDRDPKVQDVVLTVTSKPGEPQTWTFTEGPGLTGKLDPQAQTDFLGALGVITAKEWVNASREENEKYGFFPPRAASGTVVLHFDTTKGTPVGGDAQILLIGDRTPKGGYYARLAEIDWIFVLEEHVVDRLLATLVK